MRNLMRRTLFALVTAGAIAGPLALFGLVEPQTGIGYATFRAGYALSIDEAWFLSEYSSALKQFNGGYVPLDVDEFLAEVWADGDPDEQETMIDFHVMQGWGRTGSAHERLGASGIAPILHYLDTPRAPDVQRLCLGFLEGVRRGRAFGKGGFGHGGDLSLDEAESRFRAWWALDIPWAEKSEIDPLAGHDCWGEI